MIGLISAGIGLASGIYGGIKSANARRAQGKIIDNATARENAWYNNEYYKDYMDSTMARSAMKRVQDTMERNNRQSMANAVLTGATPEAQIAQQEANNQIIGDTAQAMVAQADARRDSISSQHRQALASLDGQRMAQKQADEAGASQVANNGLSILGSALSLYDKAPVAKAMSPSQAVGSQEVDLSGGKKVVDDYLAGIRRTLPNPHPEL